MTKATTKREKRRQSCREWYWRNVERERERGRQKRAKNIEYYREHSITYNAKNLNRLAVIARNRRARQKANGGRHSLADVQLLFVKQKGKCAYCRTRLGKYHVDHIEPIARGGSNDRSNLQLLCKPCNKTKSARDPLEFVRQQGLLL